MRYTGPLGKAFSGDKQRAMELQSRARVVVGRLLYALKRQGGTGQQYGTERQSDGSVIHAMVMRMIAGQEPIIRTWIESPVGIEKYDYLREYSTHEWFSGLFLIANPIYPVQNGEVQRIYPRRADSYGPWQATDIFVPGFELTDGPCSGGESRFRSVSENRGSLYSGRMREVVQLMQGMKAPIPYSYQWCLTHGIFINQTSGTWWVIEISSSSGVSAWRLPLLRKFTDSERSYFDITIPYVPDPLSAPESKRELLSHEDLSPAYSATFPYTIDMGWAFHYDGREAQNVLVSLPGVYHVVQRWKIVFVADENGDPVSAELTKEEEAYLYGSRANAPKYRKRSRLGDSLISFDINNGVSEGPSGNLLAPLDVFYVRNSDSPVVPRLNPSFGETFSIDYPPTSEWPPSGSDTMCGLNNFVLNSSVNGVFRIGGKSDTQVAVHRIEIEGYPSPISTELYTSKVSETVLVHNWRVDYGYFFKSSNDFLLRNVYSNHYRLDAEKIQGKTHQVFPAEVFFKPYYDREVFGIYHKLIEQEQAGTITRFVAGAGGGTKYSGTIYSDTPGRVVQLPTSTCSGEFIEENLGPRLDNLGIASYKLENMREEEIPNAVCETGLPMQRVWDAPGGVVEAGCYTTDVIPGGGMEELRGWERVYLFRRGEFSKVFDGPYKVYDPFTAYIDNSVYGSLIFSVIDDVFGHGGLSYTYINNKSTDELRYYGRVGSVYPVSDAMPGFNTGWFGIP